MKKQLIAFAVTTLIIAGCGDGTERQETASDTTAMEQEANEADAMSVEMENSTTDIERASHEVDSLLSEI